MRNAEKGEFQKESSNRNQISESDTHAAQHAEQLHFVEESSATIQRHLLAFLPRNRFKTRMHFKYIGYLK